MTGQLEMFENGATPFAVRRVHPNSSQALRESAHELSQRSAAVLAVYRRATHPMTDRDVKGVLGFADMNAVRPRITELIESGLLRECGRVKDAITGKMVRVALLARMEDHNMGWFDRDEGQRAFERVQSRCRNPHDDSFGADYEERRRARDWEDVHRKAEARAERRREEEEIARREQAERDRNAANRRAEEQREEAEREEYERAQAEAEAESDTASGASCSERSEVA